MEEEKKYKALLGGESQIECSDQVVLTIYPKSPHQTHSAVLTQVNSLLESFLMSTSGRLLPIFPLNICKSANMPLGTHVRRG